MRFPRPAFDELLASYSTDAESVHDCPRIYTKNPININVGYFLGEHWGKPTHTFLQPNEPPKEIQDLTGVLCFVKIPGYSGQGHMDVWNRTAAVGHGYWSSQKVLFWTVE